MPLDRLKLDAEADRRLAAGATLDPETANVLVVLVSETERASLEAERDEIQSAIVRPI
jgi:hypothetical protein